MTEEAVRRRGPGRPRTSSVDSPIATREMILDAAAQLFAMQGYVATGTREIAAAAGLRQASLFHHFARKEDLLAELLDRTVSPALAAAEWLDSAKASPEVRLYSLARIDTTNLCGGHRNLAVLQFLLEARGPRFTSFWDKRADLRGRYEGLVQEASTLGLLVDLPAATITDLVFGTVEATISWYRRDSSLVAEEVADAVASAAVRGVLRRPPSPAWLRRSGDRLVREVAGAADGRHSDGAAPSKPGKPTQPC